MRLLSTSIFSRTLLVLFCTLLIGNGRLIAQTNNQTTPVSISQAQFGFEVELSLRYRNRGGLIICLCNEAAITY